MSECIEPRPSVKDRILTHLEELPPHQRRVAQIVIANPSFALFSTAQELAARADVDAATVVRFAQAVGFAGFVEMRSDLRSEYPALRSPLDRIAAEVDPNEELGSRLRRVRARTMENVDGTLAALDVAGLERFADSILAAREVAIVAAGKSEIIGLHLYRVLETTGICARLMRDWYDFMYEASRIRREHLVIGITVWKYSTVTVETLRHAHRLGARTALLTDVPFAPGTEVSDHVFCFSPEAMTDYLSPVAGCALVDCIAATVATKAIEGTRNSMSAQYDIGARFGLTND